MYLIHHRGQVHAEERCAEGWSPSHLQRASCRLHLAAEQRPRRVPFGKTAAEAVRERCSRWRQRATRSRNARAGRQAAPAHRGHFAYATGCRAGAGARCRNRRAPGAGGRGRRLAAHPGVEAHAPTRVRTLGPSGAHVGEPAGVPRRGGAAVPVLAGEGFARRGLAAFLGAERGRSISISADASIAPARPPTSNMGTASAGCSGKDVKFAGPELERQHRQPACIAAGGGEGGLACPGRRLHLQRRASCRRCQTRGGGKSAARAPRNITWRVAPLQQWSRAWGSVRGSRAAAWCRHRRAARCRPRWVTPAPTARGNRQAAGGHRPLAHDLEDSARTRRWWLAARGASGAPNKALAAERR